MEILLPAALGEPAVFIGFCHDILVAQLAAAVLPVEEFPVVGAEHGKAVNAGGNLCAGQLQQGGHHIPELHQLGVDPRRSSRTIEDHGHLDAPLIGQDFPVSVVVAQKLPVVRTE